MERLNKAREASDLTRRVGRFLVLAKRLDLQMQAVQRKGGKEGDVIELGGDDNLEGEKEREMAKAALSIAELGELSHCTRNDNRPR